MHCKGLHICVFTWVGIGTCGQGSTVLSCWASHAELRTSVQQWRTAHPQNFAYTFEGSSASLKTVHCKRLHICVFTWAWMLWLNRVQQCWAIEQHMQNCEHDLANQCRDVLAFSKLTYQMLESFILIFPYKLFRESLRVQNVIKFFQHQCKITWRKLCFRDLHQWFPIITIATLGSFGAMLQQANNLNETF